MRSGIALVLILILAGCAAPAPDDASSDVKGGPVDLAGKLGLLVIDTTTGTVEVLSDASTLAWLSPNGTRVLWNEASFAVLLDARTGSREVVPIVQWARLYDNGTALEILEGEAVWRDVRATTGDASAPLPTAPLQGSRWTQASDDLRVLAAEYLGPAGAPCSNDLFLRGEKSARSQGCHLRVARDGRAGWTEAGGVRLRDAAGEIRTLPAPGNGTREENPVFTLDGWINLRIVGGGTLARTDVVTHNGTLVATLAGPTRLALHDVSEDGHLILLRAFR